MPESLCWPRETLKDYLNGSTDDQRLTAIETHLSECAACEQTLLELERDPDTLVVAMREYVQDQPLNTSQANSKIGIEPSVISRAVEAVKQFSGTANAPSSPLEKLDPIRLQHIGSYELLRPLGRGGMGLVMLGRHATLKKQVAIKILPSLVGDRPELVQRFQREILTAGQLSHPSIVHATDAGAEQGTHYLVMEYIDGLDLSRLARLADSLSIADACELMRQAALGLSYAHAQGVVHRDIKPSNLMLDTAGRVKILDFGLAQLSLWEDAACELTTVGQLMGTLDYMAPEQAERSGPVDYRADL
ncbi:MAG: serine/threonine protein kinase [Pirellulaceae bacterium]|nr:serine/threonine protein kinase [Pirellulaceae bacterium]